MKKEIAPFVGGGPSGKTNAKQIDLHASVGLLVNIVNHPFLRSHVRLPYIAFRNSQRIAKAKVILSPALDISIIKETKRFGDPSGRMDTVCNRINRIT